MRRYLLPALVACLLPICAWPQTTGLPPFGSLDQVGLEVRNNQDLNILLTIPIMSSPGRKWFRSELWRCLQFVSLEEVRKRMGSGERLVNCILGRRHEFQHEEFT